MSFCTLTQSCFLVSSSMDCCIDRCRESASDTSEVPAFNRMRDLVHSSLPMLNLVSGVSSVSLLSGSRRWIQNFWGQGYCLQILLLYKFLRKTVVILHFLLRSNFFKVVLNISFLFWCEFEITHFVAMNVSLMDTILQYGLIKSNDMTNSNVVVLLDPKIKKIHMFKSEITYHE